MGSRSQYVTQGGRAALQRLAKAYEATLAAKLATMSPDAVAAWREQEEVFISRWAEELDKIGDRGVEYEMMLDIQLINRSAAKARRGEKK